MIRVENTVDQMIRIIYLYYDKGRYGYLMNFPKIIDNIFHL